MSIDQAARATPLRFFKASTLCFTPGGI
jgi:hypothetical protein